MKTLKAIALLVFVSAGLFISGLWLWHGYPIYLIKKVKMSEIEFYGRIVAEDGRSIEGVSLIAEWVHYPENLFDYFFTGSSNTERKELISDSHGDFSITGIRGIRLVLRDISHPFYELVGTKKGWGFSFMSDSNKRHEADPNDPFTITMREAASDSSPNMTADSTAYSRESP